MVHFRFCGKTPDIFTGFEEGTLEEIQALSELSIGLGKLVRYQRNHNQLPQDFIDKVVECETHINYFCLRISIEMGDFEGPSDDVKSWARTELYTHRQAQETLWRALGEISTAMEDCDNMNEAAQLMNDLARCLQRSRRRHEQLLKRFPDLEYELIMRDVPAEPHCSGRTKASHPRTARQWPPDMPGSSLSAETPSTP